MPSFAKYLAPYLLGLNNKVGLVKVDWNATERDRLSVRYNLSRYTALTRRTPAYRVPRNILATTK